MIYTTSYVVFLANIYDIVDKFLNDKKRYIINFVFYESFPKWVTKMAFRAKISIL